MIKGEKLVILYADSEFTPWKENIDFKTVQSVYEALNEDNYVVVCHMVEPSVALSEFLLEFDAVINLCYGFKEYSQSDIAGWLDDSKINHISSSHEIQNLAQDKSAVEEILLDNGIFTPISETTISEQDQDELYILKPRFGGCHRNIQIGPGGELIKLKENDLNDEFCLQKFLSGREFSVGVIVNSNADGFEALPPVEVVANQGQDIFIAGNSFGSTKKVFFEDVELIDKLKELAVIVHWTIGLEYYSRIDFRMQNDTIYVLDVNAMPNMHPTKSVLPAMLNHAGIPLAEFYSRCLKRNKVIQQFSKKISEESAEETDLTLI